MDPEAAAVSQPTGTHHEPELRTKPAGAPPQADLTSPGSHRGPGFSSPVRGRSRLPPGNYRTGTAPAAVTQAHPKAENTAAVTQPEAPPVSNPTTPAKQPPPPPGNPPKVRDETTVNILNLQQNAQLQGFIGNLPEHYHRRPPPPAGSAPAGAEAPPPAPAPRPPPRPPTRRDDDDRRSFFFLYHLTPALLYSLIIRRISSGECTPVTTGGCGFHLFPCYLFPSSLQDEEDLSAGAVFGCPFEPGCLGACPGGRCGDERFLYRAE